MSDTTPHSSIAANAQTGNTSLPLTYFLMSAMSASIIHITPDIASPAAESSCRESCTTTGTAVASEVVNSAVSSPNEASLEYFSSVRLRMKFDFSLVWNISLAICVTFPLP